MSPLFLRLTSWKLIPAQFKFTFFATVKTKIKLVFCWTHGTFSSASVVIKTKETTKKFVKKSILNLNWLGRTFSWYQSQKQWCHCNSPIFYCMWLSSHELWWLSWKIYIGASSYPCSDNYMGEGAATQPEVIAASNVVLRVKPQVSISLHSYGKWIIQVLLQHVFGFFRPTHPPTSA